MDLEERLGEVFNNLVSLRQTTDGEYVRQDKAEGQRRALQYLRGGFATLEAVGPEMTAAILAALSPEHFSVSLALQLHCNALNEACNSQADQPVAEDELARTILAFGEKMEEFKRKRAADIYNATSKEAALLDFATIPDDHFHFFLLSLFLASQTIDLTGGKVKNLHKKRRV